MGWRHYAPSVPLDTDQGIKARSRSGAFAKSWWAARWIQALEQLMDPGRLRRGQAYARSGQVIGLEELPGYVEAEVQGSRKRPYRVQVKLERLSEQDWERVFQAISQEALFVARLLAGEMPHEVENFFQEVGVALFPASRRELNADCNCPDSANPCKHIAAVHYLLAERLEDDPFLLFRLRGQTQAQIMEALALREERDKYAEQPKSSSVDQSGPSLAQQLPTFWQMGALPKDFSLNFSPSELTMPAMRRLGQPKFLELDLLAKLEPVLATISEQAHNAAFTEQDRENPEEQAAEIDEVHA